MTQIRIAEPGDLPALVAAFRQEHYFTERLDRQGEGRGELFVAWDGPTPVGNGYLWRDQPYEPEVRQHLGWTPTLTHLEVAPAYQNRGIGTALIDAIERHAAGLGYFQLGLGVGVDNPDARRLYERLGYGEWEHGLVQVEWDEPGPDGVMRHESLTCHWLVRGLEGEAPGLEDWDAWRPEQAAAVLADSTVDWYVAAGWAIDLHLGRPTRPHEDLEVAIARADFPVWRRELEPYRLYDAGRGRVQKLLPGDEPDPEHHQVWLCEGDRWRMDTFLEERPDGDWVCHWLPGVRAPLAQAVTRSPAGIAYLRPEYVLLGKAKHRRPKDEADRALVLPTLDDAARARFIDGLLQADPDHPWLS